MGNLLHFRPLEPNSGQRACSFCPHLLPRWEFAIEAAIGGCLDKFLCHSRRDATKPSELALAARLPPGGRLGPLRCTKYFFDIPQYRQDLLFSLVQR